MRGGGLLGKSFSLLLVLAVAFGGFFVAPSSALAAATVNPATGGTNISIDTTSHEDCAGTSCNTFKSLTGPSFGTENGDIAVGVHIISLPSGWEFDTSSTITITAFNDIAFASPTVTPGQTSFTFEVTSKSTSAGAVGFGGLKVRPTGTTPSTGDMTYSGTGIVGVSGSTNFGTLSTVPGTVTQLAFTEQPSNTEYGSVITPNPTVVTRDQFGNDSTSGLGVTEMVSMELSGTGVLQGTDSLDIGTGGGNGIVIFDDLKAKPVGTYTLTASVAEDVFTSAESNTFDITKKSLTAEVTVQDKDYDGDNTAEITNVVLDGVESGDTVAADFETVTATFAEANAGTHAISVTDVTLTGADAGNYTLANGDITGEGTINPRPVTVTANPQTKVYGEGDPAFTFEITVGELVAEETLGGSLSRAPGEDVGVYAITIGTLQDQNPNYAITFVGGNLTITQKPLTVTATGVDKEYDGNTTATVNLSSVDEIEGDELVYEFTSALFEDKTASENKTINVSGISISGAKAGNYDLQNTTAATTANITKKPITLTINVNNKTYNGNTNATYSSTDPRVLNGVIGGDDVTANSDGTKGFLDKHVGTDKPVTASGVTLSGIDKDNYAFDGTGAGTATINARPITVTAVTDSRTYDGTTASLAEPTITTGLDSDPIASGDTDDFFQTYDTKHVDDGKTLTPDGVVHDGNPIMEGSNYDVTFVTVATGEIIARALTATVTVADKDYDGSDSATITEITLIGVAEVEGEDIGIDFNGATATFASANADTHAISVTGVTLTGADAGNYTLANVDITGTGTIDPLGVIITPEANQTKTYGQSDPTLTYINTDLIGGDTISGLLGRQAGENVGTYVYTLGTLDAGGNYILTLDPEADEFGITQKTLNVTATGVNKVYNGTTDAEVNLSSEDIVEGDVIEFSYNATFDNKNVGTGKTITITDIEIVPNDDSGNYTLGDVPESTTANITAKELTATVTVQDKVFDGTTDATIVAVELVGVVTDDDVTVLDQGTATFDTPDEGTEKSVTATGVTITGVDEGNYNFNGTATGTGDILEVPTVVFVDPSFTQEDAGGNIFGYDAFNTIQEGIDAVDAGGTVNVADGNYTETIGTCDGNATMFCVSKSLTITGNPGAQGDNIDDAGPGSTPVIDGGGAFASAFVISSGVSNVTIEGFEIRNFANDPGAFTGGIGSAVFSWNSGATNITVQDNYLHDLGWNGVLVGSDDGSIQSGWIIKRNIIGGIGVGGADYAGIELTNVTNSEVAYNIITIGDGISWDLNDSGVGIEVAVRDHGTGVTAGANVSVHDNEITGDEVAPERAGINILSRAYQAGSNALLNGVTLQNNTVTGAKRGIFVTAEARNGGTAAVTNLTIDGNTLDENEDGLVIHDFVNTTGTATHSGISIVNNSITNSTGGASGVHILADTSAADINVNSNAITGNAGLGVNNEGTGTLDAVGNWWGTSSGPTHASNPTGTGDAVSNNVNFRPWHTSAAMTELDETAPTVVSHTPGINAVNVEADNDIVITFNEAVVVQPEDITFSPEATFTLTGSGTNTITLTPSPALDSNTVYTVTIGTTVIDMAGNFLGEEYSWSFTTATLYNISLISTAGGWNLISLPVVPNNTAISNVLGDAETNIDAVWTYDPNHPNADESGWLVYVPGNPEGTNNLDIMTAGRGYWISATANANVSGSGGLLTAGPIVPPSRNLVAGWNLVGYYQIPGENQSTATDAFSSLNNSYTSLWSFNNSSGQFKSTVNPIMPGDGFWISLPAAKVYTPSNL